MSHPARAPRASDLPELTAIVLLWVCSCVNLLVPPDDVRFLRTAHEIYAKNSRYSEALTLAIRLGDKDLIRQDFEAPQNPYVFSSTLLRP